MSEKKLVTIRKKTNNINYIFDNEEIFDDEMEIPNSIKTFEQIFKVKLK
jgi:hypothetical protein